MRPARDRRLFVKTRIPMTRNTGMTPVGRGALHKVSASKVFVGNKRAELKPNSTVPILHNPRRLYPYVEQGEEISDYLSIAFGWGRRSLRIAA